MSDSSNTNDVVELKKAVSPVVKNNVKNKKQKKGPAEIRIPSDPKKLLQFAVNARKKKEETKKQLQRKKAAEERATKKLKEAREARIAAENEEKALIDEQKLLIQLAGINTESESTRNYFAGKALLSLLDKFDTGQDGKPITDAPFNKLYNMITIEELSKVVLECSAYYQNKDYVCIFGKSLRSKIEELVQKKESLIAKAKETLDMEWANYK